MKPLPDFYTSQLPSLNDCGPACATMLLKFLGQDYDISFAKAFEDGIWTFNTFRDFFSDMPEVSLVKEIKPGSDRMHVILSTYLLVGHWIVEHNGRYYCPIDGEVSNKRILNKNLFVVAER